MRSSSQQNILLVDTTAKCYKKFTPLALLRLSAHYKANGANVALVDAGSLPKFKPDIICFSFVFLFNHKYDSEWVLSYRKKYPSAKIRIGGVSPTLMPEKYRHYLGDGVEIFEGRSDELEAITPDFSISQTDYSYGFTSRGCPNKCPWCVVPKIEGHQKIVDNWRTQIDTSKRLFLAFDNNFLACGSKHVESVLSFCHENNIKIDCNQGMDAQILHKNKNIQKVFVRYPKIWDRVRFAWDSERVNDSILFALDFLYDNEIQGIPFLYMLYDNDASVEIWYERMRILCQRGKNVDVFPMRFQNLENGMLTRGWGYIGDLIKEVASLSPAGLFQVRTNGMHLNHIFRGDLNSFIEKAKLIRQYKKDDPTGYTKNFMKYCETKLGRCDSDLGDPSKDNL